MNEIKEFLENNREEKYRIFIQNLVPTKDISYFYGIRNPIMRNYAKYVYKNLDYNHYLDSLPHDMYEENMLHGYLIENIKDFNEAIKRTDEYLPYINNWSCCDTFKPKVFRKNKDNLLLYINKWLKSDLTYVKRYAIGCLMDLYLDDDFDKSYLEIVSKEGREDDYYLNMMVAWYFATALAKKWNETIPYIENHKLNIWIHNKTIQKAIESYRTKEEQKDYLRGLKIKNV